MDETTPADLSRELSVDAKAIRRYLRAKYGKRPPLDRRWRLNEAQADEVRQRFGVGK